MSTAKRMKTKHQATLLSHNPGFDIATNEGDARILKVPTELIDIVADFLTLNEHAALRLVCRPFSTVRFEHRSSLLGVVNPPLKLQFGRLERVVWRLADE